jgi:hypothetical protein
VLTIFLDITGFGVTSVMVPESLILCCRSRIPGIPRPLGTRCIRETPSEAHTGRPNNCSAEYSHDISCRSQTNRAVSQVPKTQFRFDHLSLAEPVSPDEHTLNCGNGTLQGLYASNDRR